MLLLHARQIHERKSLIFAQRRSFLNYWFLCKQKNINLKDEWVCYNFHTWKCYLFSLRSLLFRTIAVEKSASAYLIKGRHSFKFNGNQFFAFPSQFLDEVNKSRDLHSCHNKRMQKFPYHSSGLSSSFALDATVFTADDTLVSTALLLLSNLAVSLSDCVVDALVVVVVVVAVDV